MAESTLSAGITEIKLAVADFLGMGRTSGNWDADDSARADDIIESSQRRLYGAHDWSFLKKQTTLTLNAPYTTGTVTVTNGSATVTGSGTTFPSWAASGEFIGPDGVAYTVASRDSNTQLTLDINYKGTTASGRSYSLRQRDYDLPDDFIQLIGDMTYVSETFRWPVIRIVPEGEIRIKRQKQIQTGYVQLAAVRWKSSDLSDGQRMELLIWPDANEAFVLAYPYKILPNLLVTSTAEDPLGGMQMSELFMQSALALAEQRMKRELGVENALYQQMLQGAIERDGLENSSQHFGYVGDPSNGGSGLSRDRLTYVYFDENTDDGEGELFDGS